MEYQLTEWIEGNSPVLDGVYKVKCGFTGRESYAYWSKKTGWGTGGHQSADIASRHTYSGAERDWYHSKGFKWRGLSSDPSAKPKQKARGNRRVTRYVVMDDIERKPVASFATKKAAENYEESMMVFSSIEKIRFRTPEAD